MFEHQTLLTHLLHFCDANLRKELLRLTRIPTRPSGGPFRHIRNYYKLETFGFYASSYPSRGNLPGKKVELLLDGFLRVRIHPREASSNQKMAG